MSETKASPILNRLGSVFIPVTDIEQARDWYGKLLGLSTDACSIMNGHLCVLPMEGGRDIILDTMPMWGGKEPGGAPSIRVPSIMLLANDIREAYRYAKDSGVTMVTEIEYDHWFVIEDPDNNMLMVCGA